MPEEYISELRMNGSCFVSLPTEGSSPQQESARAYRFPRSNRCLSFGRYPRWTRRNRPGSGSSSNNISAGLLPPRKSARRRLTPSSTPGNDQTTSKQKTQCCVFFFFFFLLSNLSLKQTYLPLFLLLTRDAKLF